MTISTIKVARQDVIEYLENLIYIGEATQEQSSVYEDIMWGIEPCKFTLSDIVHNIRQEWNN